MHALLLALSLTLPRLVTPPPLLTVTAREARVPATSAYTVTLLADGRLASCRLLASSGFTDLDARGCELLQLARFSPATDAAGTPVSAAFDVDVAWPAGVVSSGSSRPDADLTIAQAPAGAAGLSVVDVAAAYGADGQLASCEVIAGSGSPALDAAACSAGVKAAQAGQPQVAGKFVRRLRIRFIAAPPYAAVPKARMLSDVYPERSQRLAVTGTAILRCQVQADGGSHDCTLADKWPPGMQFGAAAMKLVRTTGMPMQPGHGSEVFIPFWFSFASRHDPAPNGWVGIYGEAIPSR